MMVISMMVRTCRGKRGGVGGGTRGGGVSMMVRMGRGVGGGT